MKAMQNNSLLTKPDEIEVVQRPNLPLPRYILDALKDHSSKLGLKTSGGAVQAIEAWIESTQDRVIFPGS